MKQEIISVHQSVLGQKILLRQLAIVLQILIILHNYQIIQTIKRKDDQIIKEPYLMYPNQQLFSFPKVCQQFSNPLGPSRLNLFSSGKITFFQSSYFFVTCVLDHFIRSYLWGKIRIWGGWCFSPCDSSDLFKQSVHYRNVNGQFECVFHSQARLLAKFCLHNNNPFQVTS